MHVVSPAEFYLQLKEQFAAVDGVQEALAGYGEERRGGTPAVGQTVAALYPEDEVWYRGRVLEAAGGQVSRGRVG